MKPGQTLYREFKGKVEEVKVAKVGSRYFSIEGLRGQWLIDNLAPKDERDPKVYLTKDLVVDEIDRWKIIKAAEFRFGSNYGFENQTLENLRNLAKLLL